MNSHVVLIVQSLTKIVYMYKARRRQSRTLPYGVPLSSNNDSRVAKSSRAVTDDRLSRLEEENRNLRVRLANTSSPIPSQQQQPSLKQDLAQTPRGSHSRSNASSMTSSSVPSPPSAGEDWQAIAQEEERIGNVESTSLGLTSASVLEDTPLDSAASTAPPLVLQNSALSSQRLEGQAAEQRESSGLFGLSPFPSSFIYSRCVYQVDLRRLISTHAP